MEVVAILGVVGALVARVEDALAVEITVAPLGAAVLVFVAFEVVGVVPAEIVDIEYAVVVSCPNWDSRTGPATSRSSCRGSCRMSSGSSGQSSGSSSMLWPSRSAIEGLEDASRFVIRPDPRRRSRVCS